ncbi:MULTISPECIES: N-acetylmannosamine-6-phosphate 2-epimerase [Salmonella]|uniref:N-acetylmannosamine-6-phosphate 2-epimerase n=1 Tax=Salmonella TaxID=590 RepID=UPI001AAFF129|nr:N-acetylmannosamine-6-phosphate 2-epimerase [Salmonella enterica]MBO2431519.1 N-acetylmannosamine-6-phosphate 2-epimerase [Salmonella sp. 32070601201500089SM]MCB2246300.1 N-acetylmannosamine-6-phosphate 2-epimerase [Salmonella enterica subsp. diarizonae]EJM5003767.1 N-acetylmannosamine-6-phosphate 2-epimerase [Salmonella enterica]EJR9175470.1 N-acetylmannosamine-6-phosphate 2-epimerase [Salmonella enterica]
MGLLNLLAGKLIVSCQALPDEPLHGASVMAKMANAAYLGGAGGIVANGAQDIVAIKAQVTLPVIGVLNRHYSDSTVCLTPTVADIHGLMVAEPDLISIETGFRHRPGGERLEDVLLEIRTHYPRVLLLAAVATLEEALLAQDLGYDGITTAAYGYTPESKGKHLIDDNYAHLKALCHAVALPILAEGGINTPEQAACALRCGAHSIVVGGAITRPQNITRAFVNGLSLQGQ